MTFLQGLLVGVFIVVAFMLGRGCGTHSDTSRADTTITKHFDSTLFSHHETTNTIHHTDSIFFIPTGIDTTKLAATIKRVIEQYFAKNVFKDSIKDSNLFVEIVDTVSQNRIVARDFTYKLLRPQLTTTVVQREPARVKLFLGATLNTTFGAGGKLMMLTKKEQLFSAGYDFVNKKYQVGAAFKISFR